MPDEETPQDETTESQDAAPEEAPAAEAPAGEQAEAPAEETEAEAPAEEAPAEEPAAESPAEEAPAEEPAAEAPSEETEKPKAKDAPPGAELEPIAIEPEREMSAEERARAEAEAEERARAEAVATEEVAEEGPVARKAVELPADTRIQATGKRKSSIARVVLRPGDGTFEINSRSLEEYFPRFQHQAVARQPLVTAGYEGSVDVRVRVRGGGISGQAGAVRHGVARALTEVDPELRGELKRRGLLTRDARRKERRKAGLKKARKRPQFSKR
jgi:small subunit ribosomal protein S9